MVTNANASNVQAVDQPRGEWLAYVNGPCTIAGTVSGSAINFGIHGTADGGGAGGGGGGSAAGGSPGTDGLPGNAFGAADYAITGAKGLNVDFNQLHVTAGGGGGAVGLNGGDGSAPTTASQKWFWMTADQLVLGGSAGGVGGNGTATGADGGAGGGG
ncbi:MAG: hypothetical protein ACREQC_09690, partial [Candidatus Binataceae bacterium]